MTALLPVIEQTAVIKGASHRFTGTAISKIEQQTAT